MAKKKTKEAEPKEQAAVSDISANITKDFGDILVSGQYIADAPNVVVPVSPAMDAMLGGGIKFGSFVIPTGPPKVGKTSFALDLAATALNTPTEFDVPRHIYFMSIEGRIAARDLRGIHHLVPHLADRVTIVQSRPGKILVAEDFLDIGERFINEKPGSIFIFDSFSQLCSSSGHKKEWGDGKAYRDDVPILLSRFCKRISNVIPINKSIVVGITHQIANTGFGFSPWAEASGNKVQYQVDVKLKAPYAKAWKAGDTKIGQEINWECFCSPLLNGPVEEKCLSKLRYGYGLDKAAELCEVCIDLNIIKKKKAWFEFPNGHNANGIDKAATYLRENDTMYRDINDQYRDMMGLPPCAYLT